MKPEEYPRETSCKYTNGVTGVLEYFANSEDFGWSRNTPVMVYHKIGVEHWAWLEDPCIDL